MNASPLNPQSFEERVALLRGRDIEEYRKETAQRAVLSREGDKYLDLPPDQWPKLIFNWDLSPDGQRFALDGVELKDFQRDYPEGFRLGWVRLADFDRRLCHFSRRDGFGELWSLGNSSRLAHLIARLARGLPITPPLVKPLALANEVVLQGGHHRYAAAKAKEVLSLPIYVESNNVDALGEIVSVRWNEI